MSSKARIVLALCGLLCACELSAELGAYSPITGEVDESSTEIGSASADTGGESGTAGGTEMGETDGEPGDGDDEPGDGDGEPADDLCMIDGSEDACRTCVKFLCCESLEACNDEFGCNCMIECLTRADAVTCAGTCTPGPAYFQLLQCQATSCTNVCT